MLYLDSSVLLEVYLAQPRAALGRELMAQPGPAISSWLLVAEVSVALRRVFAGAAELRPLNELLARFDQDLGGITLVSGLEVVAEQVRRDPRFASCRALDAIHAGTALHVQRASGHRVRVATFDHRLSELAGTLGLGLALPGP